MCRSRRTHECFRPVPLNGDCHHFLVIREAGMKKLVGIIEEAWEGRSALNPGNAPRAVREAVDEVIGGLDSGKLRVAEKAGGEWVTHQWIKKAVLLSFRLEDNRVMDAGVTRYYDKVGSKFDNFDFTQGGFRVVPPAMARRGAFVAKNVV